jgi:hypothetical protein
LPYSIALAHSRSPIVCGTSSRLNPSDGHKGHFEALTDKAADAWCGTTPATDLQTTLLVIGPCRQLEASRQQARFGAALRRLFAATERRGKARTTALLSIYAPRYADYQELSMGGTGLEPVTPSLSIRGSCSHPFAPVRLDRSLSEIASASERSSEPERTQFLAILATPH